LDIFGTVAAGPLRGVGLPELLIIFFVLMIIALGVVLIVVISRRQRGAAERQAPMSNAPTGFQAAPVQADASSFGYAVLSFFIPVAGLILFLVWKDQYPLKAKSCGIGALVSVIVSVAVSLISFLPIFVSAMMML